MQRHDYASDETDACGGGCRPNLGLEAECEARAATNEIVTFVDIGRLRRHVFDERLTLFCGIENVVEHN